MTSMIPTAILAYLAAGTITAGWLGQVLTELADDDYADVPDVAAQRATVEQWVMVARGWYGDAWLWRVLVVGALVWPVVVVAVVWGAVRPESPEAGTE